MVLQVNNLERALIESDGIISPEVEQMLAVRELDLPEKVDGYAFIIDRLESMEDFYKQRAEMFLKASRTLQNSKESLKERLKFAMQELGTNELFGNDVRFKGAHTKGSLVIEDKDAVPVEYKTEVVTTEIDKKKIKADLDSGKEVPGARIEPGYSLRCYTNTNVKKELK